MRLSVQPEYGFGWMYEGVTGIEPERFELCEAREAKSAHGTQIILGTVATQAHPLSGFHVVLAQRTIGSEDRHFNVYAFKDEADAIRLFDGVVVNTAEVTGFARLTGC